MADVLWKCIPQGRSLVGEGTFAVRFSVHLWDLQECIRRRAQLPGRDMGMEKFRQVGGGGSSEGGVTEGESFVLYSILYREPVKRA